MDSAPFTAGRKRKDFVAWPDIRTVSPSQGEVRKLHEEAREADRERIESMPPLERMGKAHRLFRLVRGSGGRRGSSDVGGLLDDLGTRLDRGGIPFAIGGAFALAAHGHPRFTSGLDLMVLTDELSRVHQALQGGRYTLVNEVTFRDARTGLAIDILPVEDEAQRAVFDDASRVSLYGADRVRVISADGLALMLLREATEGDPDRRSERLRDVETLARKRDLDWDFLERWSEKMGYEEALRELRGR